MDNNFKVTHLIVGKCTTENYFLSKAEAVKFAESQYKKDQKNKVNSQIIVFHKSGAIAWADGEDEKELASRREEYDMTPCYSRKED